MKTNTLLIFLLFLFSGCAERGYTLTTQNKTRTVTAESTVDIRDTKIETKSELRKMNTAVKKERRKNIRKSNVQNKPRSTKPKAIKVTKKPTRQKQDAIVLENEKSDISDRKMEEERLSVKKELEELSRLEDDRIMNEKALVEKKLAILKNKENNVLAQDIAQKEKLAIEEGIKLEKVKEAKATSDAYKLKKVQESIDAKNVLDLERAEKIRQSKIQEKNKQKKSKEEKDRQIISKKSFSSTQPLQFNMINKIYHKFGSSEVHGHVIYLDAGGQETRLANSKVYLLPVSAKLNNWFNNYYLKNKSNPNSNKSIVNYLNSTYLNLEKNFEFYGVAEGSYYVIIESNYPSHMARNKKVYIAKRIKVGKYKKIMAVFSKKL